MRSAPHRGGFTLMELLVVISILAIIMGLGAGYLTHINRRVAVGTSAATVEAVLRGTREFAAAEGVPARVNFHQPEGTSPAWVQATVRKSVGEWHFERDQQGFGNPAVLAGGARLETEWVGRLWGNCVELPAGLKGYVDCGTSTAFDVRVGFRASAQLYLMEDPATGAVLLGKGESFRLFFTDPDSRQLGATLTLEPSLKVTLQTENVRVPLDQWLHVALDVDGTRARILVNHVVRAEEELQGLLVVEPGAPFTVGDPETGLAGAFVDEVRMQALWGNDLHELSRGVRFQKDQAPVVFDTDGSLDSRVHTRPAEVILEGTGESRDRRLVRVNLYGVVERARSIEPPGLPEEPE